MYDYHMHTAYSPDSQAPLSTMLAHAAALGLTEIAVTDHIDFTFPGQQRVTSYGIAARIAAIRQEAAAFPGLSVLVGAEFGLRPDLAEAFAAVARTHPFDFIIGATHELGDKDFAWAGHYETTPKQAAYQHFFQNIWESITAVADWDVLAHMDYICRYGRYEDRSLHYADHHETVDAILRHCIRAGKGIELNTSGLRYGVGVHPSLDFVRRYKQLGGEIITVGSDAHRPQDIASGFAEAGAMLSAAGFRYVTRFKQRKPFFEKLTTS